MGVNFVKRRKKSINFRANVKEISLIKVFTEKTIKITSLILQIRYNFLRDPKIRALTFSIREKSILTSILHTYPTFIRKVNKNRSMPIPVKPSSILKDSVRILSQLITPTTKNTLLIRDK